MVSEQNENINKVIETILKNQTNSEAEEYSNWIEKSLEGINSRLWQVVERIGGPFEIIN